MEQNMLHSVDFSAFGEPNTDIHRQRYALDMNDSNADDGYTKNATSMSGMSIRSMGGIDSFNSMKMKVNMQIVKIQIKNNRDVFDLNRCEFMVMTW